MAQIALVPLVIDDDVRKRAAEVKRYAFEHRESATALKNRMSTGTPPPGLDPCKVLDLRMGYRVIYSIEQASPMFGWCQHISVAVSKPMMHPSPEKVIQILDLFGIKQKNVGATGKSGINSGVLTEALDIWDEKLPGAVINKNFLFKFDFEGYRASIAPPVHAQNT